MEMTKWEIRILIGVGVILIFLPILFTQDLGLISFQGTGEFGDTIGGITAPFIGFFGAVLLYLTLKAQIKANKHIQDQFEEQAKRKRTENRKTIYEERIRALGEEINSFQFSPVENGKNDSSQTFQTFIGSQEVFQLLKQRKNIFNPKKRESAYVLEPKFEELKQLLLFFSAVTETLTNERFTEDSKENETIKFYFKSSLKYLFTS